MNRYILIRRLTGPSILLLLGVVALLHEADLVSWNLFIPLLLILVSGVVVLLRGVQKTPSAPVAHAIAHPAAALNDDAWTGPATEPMT